MWASGSEQLHTMRVSGGRQQIFIPVTRLSVEVRDYFPPILDLQRSIQEGYGIAFSTFAAQGPSWLCVGHSKLNILVNIVDVWEEPVQAGSL